MRKVRIFVEIYRMIAIPSLATMVFSSFLLSQSFFIIYMFWVKMIVSGLLILFVHLFQSDKLYYFNNLGYSDKSIYIHLFAIDLSVSMFSFYLMIWLMEN